MYYAVIAKCGHTGFGTGFYIPVTFAIHALSAKDAAKQARWLPRVKHDHKDAILDVQVIDAIEYNHLICNNNKDPYLQVQSIQEQRRIIPFCEILNRLEEEPTISPQIGADLIAYKAVYFSGKTKLHHPRRYYRYNSVDSPRVSRVYIE